MGAKEEDLMMAEDDGAPSESAAAADQRERDAILALGSMRRQSSHQPSAATSPTAGWDTSQELSRRSSAVFTPFDTNSPWTSTTSLHSHDVASFMDPNGPDPKFLERFSQLPYISGARKAYEAGRNSSRVVKYGTDLMESSVCALSNRVVGQQRMDQLDEFACRQLNRISPIQPASHLPSEDFEAECAPDDACPEAPDHLMAASALRKRKRHMSHSSAPSDPVQAKSEPGNEEAAPDSDPQSAGVARQSRRAWQNMLLEAGGLSAAVSEESLKSLQFCLGWLGYTTATLQDRIAFLRSFMLSLSNSPQSQSGIDPAHVEALERVKTELVDAVKNAVDILSRHAGGALPDQARAFVRGTILALPQRFNAFLQHQQQRPPQNATSEPHAHPHSERQALHDAAERLLTFAVEGCEALGSVAQVFGETLERADAWLDRMRALRGRGRGAGPRESVDALGAPAAGAESSSSREDTPMGGAAVAAAPSSSS